MDVSQLERIDVTQLPHSLQLLIDCIGVEQAYRLTCLFGGCPKYIPKHPARTQLAKLIPAETLKALIKRFAGAALEIPKPDHFFRQLRNQQILAESDEGLSRTALAHKYGLSLRQIGNIRRLDA
ncbi:Mor transcription activator family protein [Pseudomonas sp. KNUC1026]|uniref:Mor transcription activator family protein n=1 Tax=Pseudomonas sp. KNUC1026 TaxID=2893890 RepID=UPI001F3C9F36|nr:Mor transcription activator family protein [Pseudomonas sp. KNUC1026]UFH50704.1 transcriptional regulator [Pseudomonas sp. KNUC1026]